MNRVPQSEMAGLMNCGVERVESGSISSSSCKMDPVSATIDYCGKKASQEDRRHDPSLTRAHFMESKMSESDIFDEKGSASLFSNEKSSTNLSANIVNSDSDSMSICINETELSDDIPDWKGMSMNEIRKGFGIYEYREHPPIASSAKHTVLFRLPLSMHEPPKPYPTHKVDKWSHGYVRLPCSAHCFCPVDQRSGDRCRNRWDMIQEALLRNILSSQQLESAILSYNQIYAQRWNFAALHHFFLEVLDSEETTVFFTTLMPKIVQLALQLPMLITGAIPLLKRHTNGFISLSQLQVASLLANAFFCTFPRRNSSNPQSEYATYPYINFNRLFAAYSEEKHNQCESVMEKIKCLFHYFRRVTTKAPEGVITIERRYIPRENCPKWNTLNQKLSSLHITSKGTIENEGAGLLQVDFANKYVGGGVLGLGCVQEEIRFVICPELMVTMLVAEELDDTEALIVSGIERYSKYEGYSNTFKWKGDFVDETPRDDSCRRMTSIVAIDALYFRQPLLQFKIDNVTRELNKAYVGFVGSDTYKNNLSAIATGNWGCGAFRGNPKLKVLIQLMAAAVTGRSMVYFTFGDTKLRDDVAEMYAHLVQHDIDIGRLYSMISEYHQESASSDHSDFYCFLYNKSRIKPLSKYFPTKTKNSSTDSFGKSSKDTLSQRSQSVALNKDTFNKHLCEMTEEERIINWLASCDDDMMDDNVKLDVKACNDKTKSNLKEPDNVNENGSLHFVSDVVRENRQQEDMVLCKLRKNVNSSSLKESVDDRDASKNIKPKFPLESSVLKDGESIKILRDYSVSESHKQKSFPRKNDQRNISDDRETSKKIKPELSLESSELNDSESIRILKDRSIPESHKQKSLSRKSGQTKISDFFQRI